MGKFIAPGAGELDTRVTLKRPERTVADSGALVRTDVTKATRWAKVEPAKFMQVQRAMQMQQRIDLCVTLRWSAALVEIFKAGEAVLTWTERGGRLRTVAVMTCVDPDNSGRFLELGAQEGGPI